MNWPDRFREVWAVDFEYEAAPGESPNPICMVARELCSGSEIRMWRDDLRRAPGPPFDSGSRSLVVCYFGPAEAGCFLALGWKPPTNLLDLYAEFRNRTNGLRTPDGCGLLGALIYFGIESMDSGKKDAMRELALRGDPWTEDEKRELLDYCAADVAAVAELLPRMAADISLPHALFRGRYMVAVARMEATGTPLDTARFELLREHWPMIKERLVEEVDADFGVYEGTSFRSEKFAEYLSRKGLPWPRIESGRLALDDETFRQMARQYPEVAPLRELRHSLSKLRLTGIEVGADGRNRCMLSPFRSRTGRNQPSPTKFIFGSSVWLRGLIMPEPGMALAYVDWSQQEFGIAAALSGDENMLAAYRSSDPYKRFALQAGLISKDSTRLEIRRAREQSKQCVLGVQYSMGPRALAQRIGSKTRRAEELLELHRKTYPTFWKWSNAAVDHAFLRGFLATVFGWTLHLGPAPNDRSLRNFPMQANAAEMLRLACIKITERGVRVCAPIHDALLIEAPIDEMKRTVELVREEMDAASAAVLEGLTLRSEDRAFASPARYRDPRGGVMWSRVSSILARVRGGSM